MNSVNIGSYHHGDLRAELLRIAIDLAAEGGPEAVVLREAARRAGVSASAAYRHFSDRDALREAVRDAAAVALWCQMDTALGRLPEGTGPLHALRAAGEGYFTFGIEQPHLFRALVEKPPAFRPEHLSARQDPFGLLLALVRAAQPRADDDAAVFVRAVSLWSAVHGYTVLCTTDALHALPREEQFGMLPTVLEPPIRALADEVAPESAGNGGSSGRP